MYGKETALIVLVVGDRSGAFSVKMPFFGRFQGCLSFESLWVEVRHANCTQNSFSAGQYASIYVWALGQARSVVQMRFQSREDSTVFA